MADAYQIKNQKGLYFLKLQAVSWGYIYSSAKNFVGFIKLMEIDELRGKYKGSVVANYAEVSEGKKLIAAIPSQLA